MAIILIEYPLFLIYEKKEEMIDIYAHNYMDEKTKITKFFFLFEIMDLALIIYRS